MSRINGEKSRANLQRRRRTEQRLKDRLDRAAALAAKPAVAAKPAAAPAKAEKPAKKPAKAASE
jgi:hypothetical protein